jgi:hypothetical protein
MRLRWEKPDMNLRLGYLAPEGREKVDCGALVRLVRTPQKCWRVEYLTPALRAAAPSPMGGQGTHADAAGTLTEAKTLAHRAIVRALGG